MVNKNHPTYKDLMPDAELAINLLHIVRYLLFTAAEKDIVVAKKLYPLWMENEKTLQKLWGFEEDLNYIKTWYYPHCTCTVMDNDDAYPTGYYVYDTGCPIHEAELPTN